MGARRVARLVRVPWRGKKGARWCLHGRRGRDGRICPEVTDTREQADQADCGKLQMAVQMVYS